MGPNPRTGKPPTDRHDIKALLGKRGLTLADVGRLCEPAVSRQAVSAVLTSDTRSIRIETALALACGLSLAEIQNVTRADSRGGVVHTNIDANTRPARTGQNRRLDTSHANTYA